MRASHLQSFPSCRCRLLPHNTLPLCKRLVHHQVLALVQLVDVLASQLVARLTLNLAAGAEQGGGIG